MKIIVIGSGLIGVTTAYFLRRRGHDVTVLDRRDGPARETSFANAGLLTPSMAEPWNAPGSWRVLLASLGRSDAALQVRLHTLPSLTAWGVRFLRNSRAAAFHQNTLTNLRLALHSLKVMETLRQETGIEYGRTTGGSLKVYQDPVALERASEVAGRLLSQGLRYRRLSREATVELEPALAPIENQLVGAIHHATDETGDAYRFSTALAERARQLGVEFRFRTEATAIEIHSSRVTAVLNRRERFVADHYIVAAGSYSSPLLKRVGVRVPVQPAKGYSVTFDNYTHVPPLSLPVVDDHAHAVVVPFGNAIRVTAMAEFAGYNLTLDPRRIRTLLTHLRRVLPQAQFDAARAKPWCGLRPMSADSVPIIGPTSISNLFVNTGHGHLGWTLAAGSAQLLVDLVCEQSPSIDPAPFALARF